jgi:CubicO group peptidase (beta-lactamase class C family)
MEQDTLAEAQEQSPEWMIDTAGLNIAEDSIFEWLFTKERDGMHSKAIGENFYMREIIIDSVWQLAKQTAVRKDKDYVYSDMNFYLVMKVVETVSKTALDLFVRKQLYEPMHLKHITYKPLEHFKKEEIVPTEEEKIFRKQLLRGYVHDPTAALLGGVSGNAGLFSNAEDLGMLMQMLLYGGSYGGQRYFSESTVRLFTQPSEGGYRGLGWDHQTKSGMKMIAPSASVSTFGHTGFTGTCVWVDPENEIVFVFVSNRVHPSGTNQKINGMQIRQKLQQMIYDARIAR